MMFSEGGGKDGGDGGGGGVGDDNGVGGVLGVSTIKTIMNSKLKPCLKSSWFDDSKCYSSFTF